MLTFDVATTATAGFVGLGKSAAYKASLAASVALISATTWGNDPVTPVEAGKALTAALLAAGCDKSEASRKKILGAKVARVLMAHFSATVADVRDNAADMRQAVETISAVICSTSGRSLEATTDKALEAWADKLSGVERDPRASKSPVEKITGAIEKALDAGDLSQGDLLSIFAATLESMSKETGATVLDRMTARIARVKAAEAVAEANHEAEKAALEAAKRKVADLTEATAPIAAVA